jgi:hypothetical protein
MKKVLALLLMCLGVSQASEIQWIRLRGKVMATNSKTAMLTIADQGGDLMSLHVDADVDVYSGKELVAKLSDLKLGDKVTLLYNPKAAAPKNPDEPEPGGVYKPVK